MRKIIFLVLIIAVAALFVIPEKTIGEYKGLIQLKYFLKDTAYKVKNTFIQLAKTGRSEELENIGSKAKETVEKKIQQDISNTVKETFERKIEVE